MNAEAVDTPLASFEAKWSDAYPEFGLALRFDRSADREAHATFACLVFEIEHAAFGIREAQPAAIKLQWWAEELMCAGNGEARHPLTQALGARIAREHVATGFWHDAIVGALAQRDPEPAPDARALLEQYLRFFAPLASIESKLFGVSANEIAVVLALRRALRETAALANALRDGKLPLPLDVLAAHRLSRGDLTAASSARDAALHDWLGVIGSDLRGAIVGSAGAALGIVRATMAAADARRIDAVRRRGEPLAALDAELSRLSIAATWAAWCAARRSRT